MPKKRGEKQPEHSSVPGEDLTRSAYHASPPMPGGIPQHAGGRGAQGGSFAARFGRTILSHGIAVVPTALYHFQGKLDLSAQLVWFVSNILSHKWDADLPYPSLNKMAKCGGIDKTQLYDYKDRLCKCGYLHSYPRQDLTGKRETNAYDFAPLFEKLEGLIAGESAEPNAIRGDGDTPEQFGAELADTSFVARYGRVITSYGITAVPRAIFTHGVALRLSIQQAWFITYILSYRWDTPLPYPSIKRMGVRTGYSTVQLHNIKAELVQAGYLKLIPRYTAQGGQDSNAYDFSGLLDAITSLLGREGTQETDASHEQVQSQAAIEERSPRRGRRSVGTKSGAIAPVGGAELSGVGGSRLSQYGGAQLSQVGGSQFLGGSGAKLPGGSGADLSGNGGKQLSGRGKRTPHTAVVSSSQGMVVEALHKVEALKEETSKRADSNQHPNKKQVEKRAPAGEALRYSPYIAAIAADYSRELGDSAHEASNMKQALNIWQGSGLAEQHFVALMHEARKLTRRYQNRPTWDAMNNKLAYLFATLRDLVAQAVEG